MFGWEVIPRVGIGEFEFGGIEFPGIQISPHGIGIAIGVFVGAWLMARRARKVGFDETHVWNGTMVGVVGAIIGARAAYVIGHLDQFAGPGDWLQIWEGGLSLIGGLLGAFTAVWIYVTNKKIDFFELVDLGAPGMGIGIAVGRSGDLMIGDHLGSETSGWWGWQYQGGELISPPNCLTADGVRIYSSQSGCIEPGMVVHQTALYDSIWSLVIFGVVMYLARKPRDRGFLFLSWAGMYAFGRIVTDFTRVDKTWFGLGLTGSQITSTLVLAVCVFLIVRYRGVPSWLLRKPEPAVGPASAAVEPALEAAPATTPPDPKELLEMGKGPDEKT